MRDTDLRGLRHRPGAAAPPGATVIDDAVRFVVFSRHATAVTLLLSNDESRGNPHRIPLDPSTHRTGDWWHVEVEGCPVGTHYAWAVDGPDAPSRGHRFDPTVRLLDPFARAVSGGDDRDLPDRPVWGVVTDEAFDWGDDRPPATPLSDTVIYELHVRGFTRDASAGAAALAGTFEALVDRLPYLRSLGVTAVELMPIQEVDRHEVRRRDPVSGARLTNYWGYSPLAFFATRAGYCAAGDGVAAIGAFKRMVRACHAAGIEVLLDVVFNHTGEGGLDGPTSSFRGLDNAVYYRVDSKGRYRDFSGCGNTLDCSEPVVRDLIIQCLRYWVVEMRVDGFRFDLATALARDAAGRLLDRAPLVQAIAADPVLRDVKLIAEAWDAAGGYRVGSFGGRRWSEWNGRYRDDVRRFWRGDVGATPAFATRLAGSSDLYAPGGRAPTASVNFVTSHDGFTLHDVVRYARKHNERNGENDRDGDPNEISWNHGVEGDSDDPAVGAIRARQVRNLLVTLFVSQGVPMVLAGDERCRTQGGNNNAYCQDNETSWIDWAETAATTELTTFVRELIAFRRAHSSLRRRTFLGADDVAWLAPNGPQTWGADARALGMCLDGGRVDGGRTDDDVLVLFNPDADAVVWRLPDAPGGGTWRVAFDTADGDAVGRVADDSYPVAAHAAAVFTAPR